MMKVFQIAGTCAALVVCTALPAAAQMTPAAQSKLDAQVAVFQQWASSPAVVAAVKAQNASRAADAAAMTQDKWAGLSVLDPFVRSLTKNDVAAFVKAQKSAMVSEVFVSCADGTKVATLGKPSSWSHKGKPKHDVPMTGKVWRGQVETDESTGLQQIQVAVPVLDGGKPIGSMVVGLSVSELSK